MTWLVNGAVWPRVCLRAYALAMSGTKLCIKEQQLQLSTWYASVEHTAAFEWPMLLHMVLIDAVHPAVHAANAVT